VIDGQWLAVKRTDPRAFALFRRHYSFKKGERWRRPGNTNVTSAGQTMVLLSQMGDALFVWLRCTIDRLDKQEGVNCAVFRNEGTVLSSELIREADRLAWQRWPGLRHFTYVDPTEVASPLPGYCFRRAGWRHRGQSAKGKLIFERLAP
jgi:hypothetical protein